MGVKKSVFASNSERKNFYSIKQTWGTKYNIYHNLPFLNILDATNLLSFSNASLFEPLELSKKDFNRLKKTSVDYTLCDENDSPIVCIDFDGLQNGFNVGTTYHPSDKELKPRLWRKEITELKLRVARASFFPYFVVGNRQFSKIAQIDKLTIVDGIIGEVITSRKIKDEVNGFSMENLNISEQEFDLLSQDEQQDYIQNWIIEVEVINEMENNPISKLRMQKQIELDLNGYSISPLAYPQFEPGDIEGFNNVILHGAKVTYHLDDLGDIDGEAWLPNFNMPYFSGFSLIEDIAALYAMEKIRRLRKHPNQGKKKIPII